MEGTMKGRRYTERKQDKTERKADRSKQQEADRTKKKR